jgi:uncharacterized protein YjbI with pentapeptide repeats
MHAKKTAKPRKLPFSDEQIRAKAYEIWRERMTPSGSPEDDWQKAIHSLQQERARRWRKPILKLFSRLNQPLIWLEKQVIEPIAEWFDRAAIFKIIEKLSPILEAVGVLLIPVAVWWFSQSYQVQKDKQEKATRQQEAIKIYLNQLTTTFLDGDIQKNPNLQKVTRASTLALLQDPNMTGNGKGQVITFLSEIGLITQEKKKTQKLAKNPATPILSLSKADLSSANLFGAKLSGAKLSDAGLRDADLRGADLRGADLSDADLVGAKLNGVDVIGFGVDPNGVDFSYANLSGANLSGTNLLYANLVGADLSYAKLSGTDLSGADLRDADLSYAKLSGADLRGADLRDADLSGADLSKALNFSSQQIKSAENWEGALYDGKRLDDPEVSKQLGLDVEL